MNNIIKEFLEYIKVERGLSKNTILCYKKDLEDYIKFLNKNVINISKEDLYSYLSCIKDKYKGSSYARKISSIKTFYKYLEVSSYISENPIQSIERIKIPKRIPNYLEKEEIYKLIAAIDRSEIGVRDRLILDLLVFTGGRISEILNLKLSDIDVCNNNIRIIGKGNKARIIPLLKSIIDRILYHNDNFKIKNLNSEDKNLLFNISRNNFWYRINKYAKRAGLGKKIYPHIFRHSLATKMLDNGANLRYVQELLGHSDIKTTEIYTHISKRKLKEIYNSAFED